MVRGLCGLRKTTWIIGRQLTALSWVISPGFVADLKIMVAALKMPLRLSAVHDQDDRRMFPRKESSSVAKGRRVDNTLEARQEPQLNLHLRDLSLGGLSAISPLPLQRGEKLVVFFPREGTVGA
jgi:hypothetical protein